MQVRQVVVEYRVNPCLQVPAAADLLEAAELAIEQVATQAGFGTPTSLRQSFARQLHPPKRYREMFRYGSDHE
ncbi:hypothetical protein GCM10027161_76370 [Microbispora hainanensis]